MAGKKPRKTTGDKRTLSAERRETLIGALEERFAENRHRHQGVEWSAVQARLDADPEGLWALDGMERTGGEPDVVGRDEKTGAYLVCDCSAESPAGRRSLCYDREALEARKEHRPADSAIDLASALGIELLTEDEYRALQELGEFDTRTSSWVKTPRDIRALGGALFCDRRYGHVFTYHNGAQSYYAARGFRGSRKI